LQRDSDRQDAVVALLVQRALDLMIVIGGYNSSNTCNLAHICAERLPTYHIAEASCLVTPHEIRHRPVAGTGETTVLGWLPTRARSPSASPPGFNPGCHRRRRHREVGRVCQLDR
jgi:hypothetical protein